MSIAEITAAPTDLESWLAAIESSVQSPVEVIETPLSYLLVTDRHVYKIKKSVDVGEAHFKSLASRRQACVDETWLNNRLAAGVYLGVVPLVRERGGLRLGGKGVAVEWAVKTRRLRGDRSLLSLIHTGELTTEHVAMLANLLANFYFASPPEPVLLDNLCARLRRRIEKGDGVLNARLPVSARRGVRQIRAAQTDYLNGARMVLNLRVCDGRIVDGHGNLRPEHVFLERQPVIIDCIEYSDERRKTDALDDLCGLTMECLVLDRSEVAEAIMAAYRERTGDDCFVHLEAFYRSLHACERAAEGLIDVGGAKPDKHRIAEMTSYLEQADRDCSVFA